MKKSISTILLCCFIFSIFSCSFALTPSNDPFPETSIGYMFDSEGNKLEAIGHLVSIESTTQSENSIAVTYEYTLRAPKVTVEEPDDGYSGTVYLTNHYSISGSKYLLTEVSGRWVMNDPNARVISASVDYYNDAINTAMQRGSSPVSNNFSVLTGFTEYGYNTDAFTIGSVLYLTIRVGTSRTYDSDTQNFL